RTQNSPQVGFEPTTSQLTADRSTTELLRNKGLKLRKPTLVLWTPTYDRTKKGSSLFFTYTGRKGYDSKPLLGRRASGTRGRMHITEQPSTLEIRIDQSISASCQFA
ncbi:hypothetical protein S245_023646, partial [Arachis hypogaea]